MKRIVKTISLTLLVCFLFQCAEAKVILPLVFSDNMVLQQKSNAAIWGRAAAGETVVVTTSWNNKKYSAVTAKNGDWKLKVLTPSFGGPYTIDISDGELTTLKNIMIGEVWICSGQSNMDMPLSGWGRIQDYEKEITGADYPAIRLLQVEFLTYNTPTNDAKIANNGWTICSPQTAAPFSAVAYFFAREIYNKTKIPVGLINAPWGGTMAEVWVAGSILKTMSDFKDAVNKVEQVETKTLKDADEAALKAFYAIIDGKDSGYINGKPEWQKENTDISEWKTMELPNHWENVWGYEYDGSVWFRKKIMLPASWAGKDVRATLREIDDEDITWFNGEKVGASRLFIRPRMYTIPGRLVKEGENEIVIRVLDLVGGGGFFGDGKLMKLSSANGEQISLAGPWLYKIAMSPKDLPPRPKLKADADRPAVLYNGMIHPFIQYSIRGAIWYQGESNVGRAYQYRTLFPALIKGWRKSWNDNDFPFYFVQLANFTQPVAQPGESEWAELREAQLKTLALPNTGMAVTIDIGEAGDIHPKNKQEVGRRLALIALAKTYGISCVYSGPIYQSYRVEGNRIKLTFNNQGAGLQSKDSDTLRGFAIAGSDKKFYWARATIAGNRVIVSSPQVARPVAVRYDWADNPNGNLYNIEGLPASPFRTDNWVGVTYGKKYQLP